MATKPYTPEDFFSEGKYEQSYEGFGVGQSVQLDPNQAHWLRKDLENSGSSEDTVVVIKEILTGILPVYDYDGILVYRTKGCLLNCELPNGGMICASSTFFKQVQENDEQ